MTMLNSISTLLVVAAPFSRAFSLVPSSPRRSPPFASSFVLLLSTSQQSAINGVLGDADSSTNDKDLPWMSQGLLISSFSDGLLPNERAHSYLQRGLVRAMLTQLQRETEHRIAQSVQYSPCAGRNVQALDQLEILDATLQQLNDDDDDSVTPLDLLRDYNRQQQQSIGNEYTPLVLRFVYIATAMYALRFDSDNSPGKQRQRARADGKSRRNDIVELLEQLLPPDLVHVHVVTLDYDDGSIKQPEGSADDVTALPKNAHEAMRSWQPHLVYMQGGNTFWLHYCLHKTPGYRQDLIDFCTNNGRGLYIGSSAGAIVAGASMETACWKGWDDPSVVPGMETYDDWKNVCGLGLVGAQSFFPHMDDQWHELIQEKSSILGSTSTCLRDGDVLLVSGNIKSTTLLQSERQAQCLDDVV